MSSFRMIVAHVGRKRKHKLRRLNRKGQPKKPRYIYIYSMCYVKLKKKSLGNGFTGKNTMNTSHTQNLIRGSSENNRVKIRCVLYIDEKLDCF